MILVTVGTNEQPFDRLVPAAAGIGGTEELVVQYGASRVPHGRGRWVDFVPFEELDELIAAADVVVSHAGVGSILLARRHGKRALVVPRRLHLREAVDDHQLTLARRLAVNGMVELVEDEQRLAETLARSAHGTAGVRVRVGGRPGGCSGARRRHPELPRGPGAGMSTAVAQRLRGMADDNSPDSFSHRMREHRFQRFERLAATLPRPLSVIDIGGTCKFWEQRGWAGRDDISVTLVNLVEQEQTHENIRSASATPSTSRTTRTAASTSRSATA